MVKPLVIDLDGTLTPVDTLYESAIRLFSTSPLKTIYQLPLWLSRGKAAIKAEISARSAVDPATLPWNADVLERVNAARAVGRKVVLCTASDQDTADRIAEHLGLFDQVIASDGTRNLSGDAKARALVEAFGEGGFDYIGNASADLAVWRHAGEAIVVSNDAGLIQRARKQGKVAEVIDVPKATARVWARQLRLKQWAKNALLFVPLIAAQSFTGLHLVVTLIAAFVVFGMVASTTYVLNDLFDLDADRAHAHKRYRPLAAGTIPTLQAVVLVPVGLLVGLGLAWLLGEGFFWSTLAYLGATITYSFVLKQIVLVDCIWLAGLFTLRIVAGAAAINQPLSHWLLMFSVFLFLSLAYLKRYIELKSKKRKQKLVGRGYAAEDLPTVFALGVGAGYASTVVLALYLFSPAAMELYSNPFAIVVAVPIMIYWLSYMWHRAHRGEMHHDPVLFAIHDMTSLLTVALFFAVFLLGSALPV